MALGTVSSSPMDLSSGSCIQLTCYGGTSHVEVLPSHGIVGISECHAERGNYRIQLEQRGSATGSVLVRVRKISVCTGNYAEWESANCRNGTY